MSSQPRRHAILCPWCDYEITRLVKLRERVGKKTRWCCPNCRGEVGRR